MFHVEMVVKSMSVEAALVGDEEESRSVILEGKSSNDDAGSKGNSGPNHL